jgi:hypothetical protein
MRWGPERKGESFSSVFIIPEDKLTDLNAIVLTVFLCLRGVGRILLPLDILDARRA